MGSQEAKIEDQNYCIQSWTLNSRQKQRLNTFHLRSFAESWVSNALIALRKIKFYNALQFPVHSPYCDNAGSAGWVMFTECKMTGSRRIFSTVNWLKERETLGGPCYGTRMSAKMTWKISVLTLATRKILPVTVLDGGVSCMRDWRLEMLSSRQRQKKEGEEGRRRSKQTLTLNSCVTNAERTVTLISAYTATWNHTDFNTPLVHCTITILT